MRKFKQMELYYDEPGEGKGNGEGTGTGGNEPTLDDLKAEIENFKKAQAEKDKEINSLKSQLGHSNKQLEEFQKHGKTAEELANLEKEKIEKELAETKKQLNLTTLRTRKNELITELKISPQFADLVQITPEMTIESLELAVKNVAAKEKEFTTDFLKKNSITNGGFNPKDKKKDEKDFVDRMIEKNKNNETDLTKF